MRTVPLDVPIIFEVSKFRPFFRAPNGNEIMPAENCHFFSEIYPFQFSGIVRNPFQFSGIVRNYNEKSVQVDVLASERMLWDMGQIWIDWDFVKILDVLQIKQLPLLIGWRHTTSLLEKMFKEAAS